MAEQIGVIQPSQKVVFSNKGDYWEVEGFALKFQDVDGKIFSLPVKISGTDFKHIKNGARIVAFDYAPRIMVQVPGDGRP